MARIAELMERSRGNGPISNAPMGLVGSLMNSVAEATMDYMVHDQKSGKKHCKAGFEALWRMMS